MAADRHFFNSLTGSIKTLSPVAAVAITAVYAISIYAFQPEVPEPPGNIVPVPTATPRKVKQIMPADINGDGPDRTRSTRERTETVNNNETLRTNGQSNPNGNPAAVSPAGANSPTPRRTPSGIVEDRTFDWEFRHVPQNPATAAGVPAPEQNGGNAANASGQPVTSGPLNAKGGGDVSMEELHLKKKPAARTKQSTNRATPTSAPGGPRNLLPYLEQSNVRTPPRTNTSSNRATGTATGGTTKKAIKRKTKTRPKN